MGKGGRADASSKLTFDGSVEPHFELSTYSVVLSLYSTGHVSPKNTGFPSLMARGGEGRAREGGERRGGRATSSSSGILWVGTRNSGDCFLAEKPLSYPVQEERKGRGSATSKEKIEERRDGSHLEFRAQRRCPSRLLRDENPDEGSLGRSTCSCGERWPVTNEQKAMKGRSVRRSRLVGTSCEKQAHGVLLDQCDHPVVSSNPSVEP